MPTLLLAVAATTILIQATPAPSVSVEPLEEGRFRLTVALKGEVDPRAAQAVLAPRAVELCGDQPVQFGRYEFRGAAPVEARAGADGQSVTLVQEIACGAAASVDAPGPARVLSEAETAAVNPRILELTQSWFAAFDEGRDADSLAMTSDAMHGGLDLGEWTAREKARRAGVGATRSRQVGRLTWYQNPTGQPPGHYVAVDYVADYERQDECGYVVWFRLDEAAPFSLVRQEITYIPRDLPADAIAAIRRQACILL